MIDFLFPQALLLALPVAALWWHRFRPRPSAREIFALALALLLVVVIAGPMRSAGQRGGDLVIVVDRSRSMSEDARDRALEIIGIAEKRRGEGDRVGVVAFGEGALLERGLDERAVFRGFEKRLGGDASELARALERALEILPRSRAGRILVLSDGFASGRDARLAASEASARGVPIDYQVLEERPQPRDIAVEDIDLPQLLRPGEAFRFQARLSSTEDSEASWRLRRNGIEIATGSGLLRQGVTTLPFRDRAPEAGLARYELEVIAADEEIGDQVPENDIGRAALMVEATGGVLHLSSDGDEGNLGAALRAQGRRVRAAGAEMRPLTFAALSDYELLVLEDFPVADFRMDEFEAIRRFVTLKGGGLLVTGGRRSFARGGYRKSRLADLMPVTMELDGRRHRNRLALAIALDRSGSMSAVVDGGATKMDLANLGAAAAIELLSDEDEVAVFAVDTGAHRVVPLSDLSQRAGIMARTRSIESSGGGIYVDEALRAASRELLASQSGNRHILLFADASDAEEPGDHRAFLPQLVAAGIRVSVIALGEETDSDAALLKEIAALGEGSIHFSREAESLPQLFSMETASIAKSGFIEETTTIGTLPDLMTLGALELAPLPEIGGYNEVQLRDGAAAGLMTLDDPRIPLFAFWQRGGGRVATFAAEVDGRFSGALGTWPRYGAFFAAVADWLAGSAGEDDLHLRSLRRGREVEVRLTRTADDEAALSMTARFAGARLVVIPEGVDREPIEVPFRFESADELVARYLLEDGDLRHHRALIGDRAIFAGATQLPWSPEFQPRLDRSAGRRLLAELAGISQGRERLDHSDLFAFAKGGSRLRPMMPLLLALWLLLLLGEIAWRRLDLFNRVAGPFTAAAKRREIETAPEAAVPGDASTVETPAGMNDASRAAIEADRRKDPLQALREARRRAGG